LENWSWFNKEERKKRKSEGKWANVRDDDEKRDIGRMKEKARFGIMIFCKVFFIVVL
jgi:hypothetical protein